jgi:hypothetical protein
MAIAILGHKAATGTTAAMDTTGATLLVAANDAGSAGAPTDSASNTWTAIDNITGGSFGGNVALYYVNNPTTSATHTFTSAGGLSAVFVVAASGTNTSGPLETSTKSTANQPGSITPATDGSLLVVVLQPGGDAITGINSSFVLQDTIAGTGGVTYGGGLATLIQGTAAAVNPTWTVNAGGSGGDIMASFKPAAGGGGTATIASPSLPLTGVQ